MSSLKRHISKQGTASNKRFFAQDSLHSTDFKNENQKIEAGPYFLEFKKNFTGRYCIQFSKTTKILHVLVSLGPKLNNYAKKRAN